MKFLVLGCNGMAGHTVSIYLKEQGYEVDGFAREQSPFVKTITGDARDLKRVREIIRSCGYSTVVNCIGVLNQSAENDHETAVFLNAYFPQFLAKAAAGTDTQIIQISTDCVFSGNKGGYKEGDLPDGTLFYDRSKALGEVWDDKDVTFRNSIIGPDMKKTGIGLVNWFMQQEGSVHGYKNAIWTGQTTLQLAKTIERAAVSRVHGLHHMVPENSISKYELLLLFNKYLRAKPVAVVPEDRFKIDKSLVRTDFTSFNYKIPSYETQIKELGNWMRAHRDLYPHYRLQSSS